jgi:DNA gyrase subunit A
LSLLDGIGEKTVDFQPSYDGKDEEPIVLPARFPNLLVNGSQGIAVGMATNIPPHNLGEVIDATIHLLEHPDATTEDLMQFVRGPDFPTGGLILGRRGIEDAYRTGRGAVKMRAVAEIEADAKGGPRIVVTEIPYQTSVEAIERKVADLVNARELDGIRAIRNESAKGKTRLVIELKRDANSAVVLNNLYKSTPLQTSFGVNMLALVDGVPRTLDLAAALRAYIDHQVEVITRRSEHRLEEARKRAHILEGLLKALDMIDAIITLIRGSESAEAARLALVEEPFGFSETQAQHILDMQLRRLAQLEHQKLRSEFDEKMAEIAELEAILADEGKLRGVIRDELGEIRETYASERRSQLVVDDGELDALDLIDDEEIVVVLSANGFVKTVAADAFRTQGRGGKGVAGTKLREEDYVAHLLTTTAHAYLLFFTERGRVYRVRAHQIPMKDRTARGTALVNILPIRNDEHVQAVIDTRTYEDGAYLFFATRKGVVKKTRIAEYDSSRVSGLIALKLNDGDELVKVVQTTGTDDVMLTSRRGQTIRFSESDVRPMGRPAAGVRGMRLRNDDDGVVSCDVARPGAEMLYLSSSGHGKRTPVEAFNRKGRGGQGVRGMLLPEARGQVVAAFTVEREDEILVFSSSGKILRMSVEDISQQGRDATGVRVARLEAGETLVAAAPVLEQDDEAS